MESASRLLKRFRALVKKGFSLSHQTLAAIQYVLCRDIFVCQELSKAMLFQVSLRKKVILREVWCQQSGDRPDLQRSLDLSQRFGCTAEGLWTDQQSIQGALEANN